MPAIQVRLMKLRRGIRCGLLPSGIYYPLCAMVYWILECSERGKVLVTFSLQLESHPFFQKLFDEFERVFFLLILEWALHASRQSRLVGRIAPLTFSKVAC